LHHSEIAVAYYRYNAMPGPIDIAGFSMMHSASSATSASIQAWRPSLTTPPV
jgi:hypothetical protein